MSHEEEEIKMQDSIIEHHCKLIIPSPSSSSLSSFSSHPSPTPTHLHTHTHTHTQHTYTPVMLHTHQARGGVVFTSCICPFLFPVPPAPPRDLVWGLGQSCRSGRTLADASFSHNPHVLRRLLERKYTCRVVCSTLYVSVECTVQGSYTVPLMLV